MSRHVACANVKENVAREEEAATQFAYNNIASWKVDIAEIICQFYPFFPLLARLHILSSSAKRDNFYDNSKVTASSPAHKNLFMVDGWGFVGFLHEERL